MLDDRLRACAKYVSGNGIVCDIGTDHANLVIFLVKNGICPSAIATEINDGPLKSAGIALKNAGISSKVTLIKTDGLTNVPAGGVTDVVIAGMGGELISQILIGAGWVKNNVNLILQPMTRTAGLRKFLYNNGFEILSETAVKDENFFYTIINAKYCGAKTKISECFSHIGKIELNNIIGREYAKKQANRLKSIALGLHKSNSESSKAEVYMKIADEIYGKLGDGKIDS